jgi:hypothetical protein
VTKLLEIFSAQKRMRQQQRELDQLQEELTRLRAQNESMREGMRRCVTCEYRIDFKERQDSAIEVEQPPAPLQADHIPE